MWLCHRAGTVACICVSFGLKTLPDIPSPVVPTPWPRWVQHKGKQELVGTMSPGTRAPQRAQPPHGHVGLSVGAGLHRPTSPASLRAS